MMPFPHRGETHPEGGTAAGLIIGIILFVASGIFTYNEFQYAAFSRVADAKIYQVRKTRGGSGHRGRRDEITYSVRYRWTDPDDGEREDIMSRPESWTEPENKMIRIEYLPGVKSSRALGERNYLAITFFCLTTIGVSIWFTKLWIEGARFRRQQREKESDLLESRQDTPSPF